MQPAARLLLRRAARRAGALEGLPLWQAGGAAAVTPSAALAAALLAAARTSPVPACYTTAAAGGDEKEVFVGQPIEEPAPSAAAAADGGPLPEHPPSTAESIQQSSSYQQAYEAHRAEQMRAEGGHYASDEQPAAGSHEAGGEQIDEEGAAVRAQLLDRALKHVPRLGWTQGALVEAAGELGLSPAAAGLLGSSDAQFVQAFVGRCNRQLEAKLAEMKSELAGMRVRDRVATGVRLRLSMLAPYIDSWPRALALLAAPQSLPRTMSLAAEAADIIWHAAGDTSTDFNWYTKRGLLLGVYSATELYMLTDCSPGYAETWAQLDRRLEDALSLGKAASDPAALIGALGNTLSDLAGQAAKLAAAAPGLAQTAAGVKGPGSGGSAGSA